MATHDFNADFRSQVNHNQPTNYHGDGYNHHQDSMGNLNQPPSFPPSLSQPLYDTQYDSYNHQQQYSQTSFHDESPFVGGRIPGADHDREDIPLKANVHSQTQGAESRWMNDDTNYEAGAPMDPDLSTRRKRRRTKKNRFFDRRTPWVTWFLTAVDIGVFIGELIYSAQLTGSPIETHPTFNPMVGPSAYVQINMGSRFVACMKNIPGVQDANATIYWPCPNTTTADATAPSNRCTLSELCGFSGVPNPTPNGSLNDQPEPNQWFRFIVPMFLHAGFVHIGFNMLMQLTVGADVERKIGWWRYSLVYFSSGIFGFVMGGNYAAQGISSTGASGALFGLVALTLLDLLYTWNDRRKPWVELIFLIVEIAVSFVLGLLPGLDNFSHIGGFIMGLAMGLCMMRSPNYIRERIGLQRRPYVVMSGGAGPPAADDSSHTNPNDGNYADTDARKGTAVAGRALRTFQGRKPLWWAWWLVRAGALVAVVIGFILLVTDFYKYPKSTCSWCYRLSCLPVNNWCSIGNLDLTSTPSS